jgi:hypothetical protein
LISLKTESSGRPCKCSNKSSGCKKPDNLLTSREIISFSMILLHGVKSDGSVNLTPETMACGQVINHHRQEALR